MSSKRFAELRKRATERPVVKVESIVDPEPEADATPAPPVLEEAAPEEATPQETIQISSVRQEATQETQAEPVQEPPKQQQEQSVTTPVPTQTTNPPANLSLDLAALLQNMPQVEDEDGDAENEKVTIYFEPSQWQKLSQIRQHFQRPDGELPNIQDLMRFLIDQVTIETFTGFGEYVKEREVQRLLRVEQRRMEKALKRIQRKHRKITR